MDKNIKTQNEVNPIEWVNLISTANHLLNAVIAYTAREEMKELEKAAPDPGRIAAIQKLFEETQAIRTTPENFKSREKLEDIIETYRSILDNIR